MIYKPLYVNKIMVYEKKKRCNSTNGVTPFLCSKHH